MTLDYWLPSFSNHSGSYYDCPDCGAVVEDDNRKRHEQWHDAATTEETA